MSVTCRVLLHRDRYGVSDTKECHASIFNPECSIFRENIHSPFYLICQMEVGANNLGQAIKGSWLGNQTIAGLGSEGVPEGDIGD